MYVARRRHLAAFSVGSYSEVALCPLPTYQPVPRSLVAALRRSDRGAVCVLIPWSTRGVPREVRTGGAACVCEVHCGGMDSHERRSVFLFSWLSLR